MKHNILHAGAAAVAVAIAGCGLLGSQPVSAKTITTTPERIVSDIAGASNGDTIKLEVAGADGTAYNYGGFTIDRPLTIDGNNATITGSTITVSAQDVTIKNLNFVGTEGASFSAVELTQGVSTSALALQNNTFSNYMQPVHSGGAEISHSRIVGNTFVNSLQSDIFIMVSGSGVLVRDNNFSNGVQIRGIDTSNVVSGVQYVNNSWRMINGQWGVTGIVGLYVNDLTVRSNKFSLADGARAGGSAVALINNVAGATIVNNSISGVSNGIVSYNSGDGDDVNSNITIDGNKINGVAKYAIALQGYTDGVTISNNDLSNAELGIVIDGNDVRYSNITVGAGNTFNNLIGGIYAKPDVIPDDQKIVILDGNSFTSNAFDIYDEENGVQIDDQRSTVEQPTEPDNPGESTDPTTPDDGNGDEVTQPVDETTDAGNGDVTAPNTGSVVPQTSTANDSVSTLATITTAIVMLMMLAGVRAACREDI